ncbi:hypothetical protein B7R76_06430 [Mageeibacillus indolicus]|uniref:histidine kinase n=1 Tax=Mageeibacillus indolicus TaxID=884684 RepID=A0A2J8B135_9FIRM|nr:HAMP domain-containing sensor histidine kinase [Mageeibacillus indolicus]PNH18470.1 hypothetical protein B7R76_06430 [Mageeibacillus indolicus]
MKDGYGAKERKRPWLRLPRLLLLRLRNCSIMVKLLTAALLIFGIMVITAISLIEYKQALMHEEIERKISEGAVNLPFNGGDGSSMVIIGEAQINTMAEYRLFVGYVLAGTLTVGGGVFMAVIVLVLRPLKVLTRKIEQVDINNIAAMHDDFVLTCGSYELRELSAGFQSALDKIYADYEKQKRFSSNVAHELRTPLAVLLMKLDVYRKRRAASADPFAAKDSASAVVSTDSAAPMVPAALAAPGTEDELLEILRRNLIRLHKLVEDILLLTREETHPKTLLDVNALIDEIIVDRGEQADAKGVELKTSGATSGSELNICTDEVALARIIANLVDNAINYTPHGGFCEISAGRTSSPAGVNIEVRDNGIGIPDGEKSAVFGMFYRVEGSRNRATGGSGIGLAIVEAAVKRLGGSITIVDNVPKGSIFRCFIPDASVSDSGSNYTSASCSGSSCGR